MRTRKTARPSTLPGKKRGRPAVIGKCLKCGTKGCLVTGLCRRCYSRERYRARPGVAERIVKRALKREIKEKEKSERKAKRLIKEKEKQLRQERWRATHPGLKNRVCRDCGKGPLPLGGMVHGRCRRCNSNYYQRGLAAQPGRKVKVVGGPPLPGSEDWLAEWLACQVESFVKTEVPYFGKNGTRFYAVTGEQLIKLLKIGYMFKHRNTHEGWNHRKAADDRYLDRSISPELRGLTK